MHGLLLEIGVAHPSCVPGVACVAICQMYHMEAS